MGVGGENIKRMRRESGAKINFESLNAAHERPLKITGNPNAVERAKELVQETLDQNDDGDMEGKI